MPSDVKVTISGDSSSLEKSFRSVGSSAEKMAGDLASSEGKARSFGAAMDRTGEAAGGAEGKFMGTADLLDGLGGAFGLPTEKATGMFRAFGDLSGGFEAIQPLFGAVVGKIGALIGITAAETAATEGATVAQGGLNAALLANPVGLVVIALIALVAAFVLAWKNSETFRDIVKGAFDKVKDAAVAVWDFIKDLPGKLMGIAGAIKDAVLWPYKTAFNAIARLWNDTVGKLSFSVPDWVPGIGGKGFSMPKLPEFHTGGIVPGPAGMAVPILAMAGETVSPAGMGGGGITVNVYGTVVTERQLVDAVHDGLLRKQKATPLGLGG
jgi:phage-related protein